MTGFGGFFCVCVCVCVLLLLFKGLFIFRGEGKEKERETNSNVWLPIVRPPLGTRLAAQACALTGNQTKDPLVCRLVLNPLSHTSQGYLFVFLISSPLHPFYHTPPPPTGNHQNAFYIYDSVSVLLVYLVCFLDSIVDRYVLIPFYCFIILIFFLNKSL